MHAISPDVVQIFAIQLFLQEVVLDLGLNSTYELGNIVRRVEIGHVDSNFERPIEPANAIEGKERALFYVDRLVHFWHSTLVHCDEEHQVLERRCITNHSIDLIDALLGSGMALHLFDAKMESMIFERAGLDWEDLVVDVDAAVMVCWILKNPTPFMGIFKSAFANQARCLLIDHMSEANDQRA